MKELTEDILQIAFDRAWEHDVSCLIVGRIKGEDLYIVNQFTDEDAEFIYNIITREKSINEAIYDRCEKEYKENGW